MRRESGALRRTAAAPQHSGASLAQRKTEEKEKEVGKRGKRERGREPKLCLGG